MYCKNCGRQLKEGTRFCDRCGHSVRKSKQSAQEAKRKEIETLKEERLNRKKRLAEKEAKQARNKKRKKNGGGVFVFIIVALLVAVLSVIIGYNLMNPDSTNTNNGNNSYNVDTTAAPVKTNAPATAAPAVTSGAVTEKNGYTTVTVGSVKCPYPSTFRSNTASGNEKLNLTDSLGGAEMIVCQEGKGGAPADLMRDYARQKGGNVLYSRAGDDWYAVTVEDGNTVYHRKCIIRNGISVYYDFSYSASSTSKAKYDEYIQYIDSNFK